MKDLFSFALYKEGLKKVRPLGIGLIIAMALLGYLGTQTANYAVGDGVACVSVEKFMPFSALLVLFVPVLTYAVFSFINDRSAADFYHAIPHKRRCVFISLGAAVLSFALLTVLSGALASYIGWEGVREVDVTFGVLFKNLVCYSALSLLAAACTALAMMFTGTPVSAVFAAIALIWIPPLVALVFQIGVEELYPQQAEWHSLFSYVGFSQYLPIRLISGEYGYKLDAGLLINVLASAVMLFFACKAYEKRASESAGRSVVGALPKHIIRGAVPFFFLIMAIYGFAVENTFSGPVFLGMGLVAYLVYELISTASIKRTLRSLPWFLAVAMAAGIFVGGVLLTAYCLEVRVPENADKVESISLYYEGKYKVDNIKPAELAVLGETINDRELIDAVLKDFHGQKEGYRYLYTCDLKIKLKSGGRIWRKVRITNSYEKLEEYVKASVELGKRAYPVPKLELKEDEDKELWDTFCAEYEKLHYDDRYVTITPSDKEEDFITYYVRYVDNGYYGISRKAFFVYADLMPKTYNMLKEKGRT